jgi:ADP-heptose:LPS heptosyltransferase
MLSVVNTDHILIIRAGALGDTILLLPIFSALKHRFPNALLEVIGYPTPLSLPLHAGLIDRIRSIDDADMAGLFKDEESTSDRIVSYIGRFETIIACCRDLDQTLQRNLSRSAPDARIVVVDPFPPAGIHAVDWYFTALRVFDILSGDKPPRMVIPEDDIASGRSFLVRHGLHPPVIAVHPGSGGRQKCWPASSFAAVIDRLTDQGINLLLICGPADREVLRDVEVHRRSSDRVVLLGDPPPLKLAAVLSVCDSFLGNDSGVTHLAAAVGCPTVAIFGPTDPVMWGPRGQHVTILSCEGGEWVDVDTVLSTLSKILPNFENEHLISTGF